MTNQPEPYPDAFPWLKHLDREDRASLLIDLSAATATLNQDDAIDELNRVVHEWANTAIVLANPELRAALTGDKDIPGSSR
ncbi:hypothetical protein ACH4TX_42170 [Streptomyces sp. NPDC021098]|uniref:hypothetical protein n=1 Tax=unclassified Streptomyces TaxID=2593676 RepID=UPI003796A7AC